MKGAGTAKYTVNFYGWLSRPSLWNGEAHHCEPALNARLPKGRQQTTGWVSHLSLLPDNWYTVGIVEASAWSMCMQCA